MTKLIVAFRNFANEPKNHEGVHLTYFYTFSINSKNVHFTVLFSKLDNASLKFTSTKVISFSQKHRVYVD